jgi:Aldo/keto reductase family
MASSPPFNDHGYSSSSAASDYGSAGSNTQTSISTSSPQRQRSPPALILDSSCPLMASQTAKSLPKLLAQLQTLPLPLGAVDTAPTHPSAKQSCPESLLGDAQVAGRGFAVDTKVRVFGNTLGAGKGELKAARVRESLKGSLDRLRVNRVRVLFAHRPDAEVPVGELAGGFGAMESDGWCEMVSIMSLLPW